MCLFFLGGGKFFWIWGSALLGNFRYGVNDVLMILFRVYVYLFLEVINVQLAIYALTIILMYS